MHTRTVLFILSVSIAATLPLHSADKPYGLEAAKEAVKQMVTADGLEVSLFAAEPMIQNPTNIDIDPRGRVWAAECVNYRKYLGLRPDGDRVVILEDTDGDGLADKEKTFFQSKDLTNPLGICVLPQTKGTKVIVSAAPNVWLLTDADGDDVAEDAKVIFKVGGVWNYDHQIHAFVVGPDGKFYFNSGNSITELTWPDGTKVKDMAGNEITASGKPYRQGMVFRCDIDLETGKASNIETLGHNFRNNYEAAVDSFGTIWQSDNDDDGNKGVRINYVMEFGNFGFTDEMTGSGWQTKRANMETEIPFRHWHLNDPGVVPNLLQTGGGSPTGILVNEGTLLGKDFTNQLIHCDAGPRTVRAYPVEDDGAGYSARMVDILTSPNDSWYRPSDVAIAPDGALFVADWYDPGVGGHAMGDHDQEKIRGRVYRVAPKGVKASVPKLDLSNAAGAVAALRSPNLTTQYVAAQTLRSMGAKAQTEVAKLAKSENPRFRARALYLLARLPDGAAKAVETAVTDSDSNLRIVGIRLARELNLDVLALVTKLARDPSAQVRRECAIALRGNTSPEAANVWAGLAKQYDGKDRWYLEALGIGAAGNDDRYFEAWLAAVGEKWNTPAGRDIIWRLRSAKTADYLTKVIADKAIEEPEKMKFVRGFDFLTEGPERNRALIQLVSAGAGDAVVSEALERLSKSGAANSPEVKAAMEQQLTAARGTPRLVELVRGFKIKGQGAALLEVAMKNPTDPSAVEAVRLALAEPDAAAFVSAALAQPGGGKLVELLGANADRGGLAILLGVINDPNGEMPMRMASVQALARSPKGIDAMLKLAAENKFPADLKLNASAALNSVQYPQFKKRIEELFPAPNALGGKPLPPVSELAKMKGDVARGKALFAKAETTCITCHRVGDVGVDFAPALTEIGTKLGKEAIFESIINPNAGISMGFETWQIDLKDGGSATGILRSETKEELVLALPMGLTTKLAKSNVGKREKLPTSMMPSGLNQALTQQDLVDMVEYLFSLKKQ